MSDVRVGSVFRAVRRRLGWRQRDVAERAGVHQQTISLIERGRLELVGIRRLRRIAKELEIDVDFVPRWRGASVDRLVDVAHAAVVDAVVGRLRACGFAVLVEWSFNHFGERGAIDVVGWQADTRTLVIVENQGRHRDLALDALVARSIRPHCIDTPPPRAWLARHADWTDPRAAGNDNESRLAAAESRDPCRGSARANAPDQGMAAVAYRQHRRSLASARPEVDAGTADEAPLRGPAFEPQLRVSAVLLGYTPSIQSA